MNFECRAGRICCSALDEKSERKSQGCLQACWPEQVKEWTLHQPKCRRLWKLKIAEDNQEFDLDI